MLSSQYKYVVRETKIKERVGGDWRESRRIVLGVQDLNTMIIYPHPLTNFIEKEYYFRSKSLSHQKRPAETIKLFLNYINQMIDEEDKDFVDLIHTGIKGLTTLHGTRFLNYCNEELGNSYKTVKGKEMYLSHFYFFLSKQDILVNKPKFRKRQVKYNSDQRREVIIAPFKDVNYPSKENNSEFKKKKDLITQSNPNRFVFIREFLLTAKHYDPRIALAIAFQFYGGLRSGECMNLKTSSITTVGNGLFGEQGMVLKIRDNQEELFPHLKDTTMVGVKRPRDQAVLRDSIIPFLYKEHLHWRDNFIKQANNYNKKALFFDDDGNALSGQNYRKRLHRIKDIYLNLLSETKGRIQDYKELEETTWSTHIGRGSFTNLCIEAGFSVEQTAIARGDKTLGQAIHYTDIINATHNITKAVNMLDSNNLDIDMVKVPEIKRSWSDIYYYGKTKK